MTRSSNLCESCSNFIVTLGEGHDECSGRIAPSFIALKISASVGCNLCALVFQYITYGDPESFSERNISLSSALISEAPINLEAWSLWKREESGGDVRKVNHLHARVGTGDEHQFPLWALQITGDSDCPGRISSLQPEPDCDAPYSAEGVEAVTSLAKMWMLDCIKHHSTCQLAYKRHHKISQSHTFRVLRGMVSRRRRLRVRSRETPLSKQTIPTRLIDVGTEGDELAPKLFITDRKNDSTIIYATLSYAWGDETLQAKTTTSNLRDMEKRLDWSLLPRTIQDAIIVTRKLGLRYLWVDALCILQSNGDDDINHKQDWHIEAARFAQYYRRSALTIAATGATGSNEGLFLPRPALNVQVHPLTIEWKRSSGCTTQVTIYPRAPSWVDEIRRSPLNRRGWAVQERLVSPRVLHFGVNCVLWECYESRATESNPSKLLKDDVDTWSGWNEVVKIRELSVKPPKSSAQDIASMWFGFLQFYTNKEFTLRNDTLPALSGLAAVVQTHIKQGYYAGIWEKTIPSGLAWMSRAYSRWDRLVPGSSYTYKTSNIPSWSWAASRGDVDFQSTWPGIWKPSLRVIKKKVDTVGAATSGQILAARLRLRGLFQELDLGHFGFQPGFSYNPNILCSKPTTKKYEVPTLYLDTMDAEEFPLRRVFCLFVGLTDFTSTEVFNALEKKTTRRKDLIGGALILEPTGRQKGGIAEYKRIGFLCLPYEIYWSHIKESRTIDLI